MYKTMRLSAGSLRECGYYYETPALEPRKEDYQENTNAEQKADTQEGEGGGVAAKRDKENRERK